ncbi:MAG: GtrA family protein [Clostridia bacterium]|nr:GtrA family protein [Clostridia bacterium]
MEEIQKEESTSETAENSATEVSNTANEISINTETSPETMQENESPAAPAKMTKTQQFLQFLKFTAFSASAGVIQLLTTTTLHQWTGWLIDYYWIAYIIGLTLSVIWNFTFNRKFTFKEAHNIKLAMVLVILYNCIIVIPLAFGGNELERLWGPDLGIVVTVITLLINFVTEFAWDKLVVFNKKSNDKILSWFKKKK